MTSSVQIKEFTEFICTLAERSGEVIKAYFAKADLAVEIKEDQTIVTQADRQAEAEMRDLIRKKYPQHGILGEEFGRENPSAEFVWTLDPIDGTISFARGCPLFGTLIGLLHGGTPVLGAIHHPVLNQLCIGNKYGNHFERSSCATARDRSSLRCDAPNYRYCEHWQTSEERRLRRIAKADAVVPHVGGLLRLPARCFRRGGHHARPDDESLGYSPVGFYHTRGKRRDYDMVRD